MRTVILAYIILILLGDGPKCPYIGPKCPVHGPKYPGTWSGVTKCGPECLVRNVHRPKWPDTLDSQALFLSTFRLKCLKS